MLAQEFGGQADETSGYGGLTIRFPASREEALLARLQPDQ